MSGGPARYWVEWFDEDGDPYTRLFPESVPESILESVPKSVPGSVQEAIQEGSHPGAYASGDIW